MLYEKEFPWVEGGVKLSADRFKRHIMIDLSQPDKQFNGFRHKYNNSGIYHTAYRYDRPEQAEAMLYGNVYLDFDSDSDEMGYEQVRDDAMRAVAFFSAIFGISADQLRFYFSGKKGIHILIPAEIMAIAPDKELNEVFRLIARDVHNVTTYKTVDLRIYDRVRLFRVVNSEHPDTGLYKVPMSYKQLVEFSYDDLQKWASKKRKHKPLSGQYNAKAARVYQDYIAQWGREKVALQNTKRGERKLDFTPPCLKHILQSGAMQGKRNNTAAALVSFFKQRGYSEQEAFDKLKKWNRDKCNPPLNDRELKITLNSIYKGEYVYGCRTLEDLSICDKENCKLAKKN